MSSLTSLTDISDSLSRLVDGARPFLASVSSRRSGATGFVFSADGVIVTAAHVLGRDEGIEVTLDRPVPATVIGRDPATDVALLRVEATGLPVPRPADAVALKVGHLVIALSRPGRSVRATLGIVNTLGESFHVGPGGRIDRYVQSDVALQPGFSGGLLLDASGLAVGLNTSGLVRGVGLTIPFSTVNRVAGELLSHGSVRRGYLGILTSLVQFPPPLASEVGQETGLAVLSVQPGSPAERGGILLGDILLSAAGERTTDPSRLHLLLDAEGIGKEAPVRLLRAGRVAETRVQVGAHP